MALLHTLLKVGGVNLHLAHVDHRWRKESTVEAEALRVLAEKLGLPFHLESLNPDDFEGNLEACCRKARYSFFTRVAKEVGAQAVVLAHHKDDQAETALKGILQGNALPFLGGMETSVSLDDLVLWRPFLTVPKKVIEESLSEPAFDDVTNRDQSFLRARMRETIIPQLSKDFGKEVSGALCRLSEQSKLLQEYLDNQIAPAYQRQRQGPLGICLPVDPDLHPVEMEHLIRRVSPTILPASQVERICQLVIKGVADRAIQPTIYVDRGSVFFLKEPLDKLKWEMSIEKSEEPLQSQNWLDLWERGSVSAILPEREYRLGQPKMNEPYHGKATISKWWGEHKIAAFLRRSVPILWEDRLQRHELLSGKCWFNDPSEERVKVTVTSRLQNYGW